MFPIYTKSIHYAGIRGFNTALDLIYVVYSGLSIMRIRLERIKVLKITKD